MGEDKRAKEERKEWIVVVHHVHGGFGSINSALILKQTWEDFK